MRNGNALAKEQGFRWQQCFSECESDPEVLEWGPNGRNFSAAFSVRTATPTGCGVRGPRRSRRGMRGAATLHPPPSSQHPSLARRLQLYGFLGYAKKDTP